jgi:hypothetical protein
MRSACILLISGFVRTTIYCSPPQCIYNALRQTLTTNTVTFSISSSLYYPPPDHHNKHSNIQYQFLSIYPPPDTHKNKEIFSTSSSLYYQQPDNHKKTELFSISFSLYYQQPEPHNKNSNVHYQFLSTLLSTRPSQITQ